MTSGLGLFAARVVLGDDMIGKVRPKGTSHRASC